MAEVADIPTLPTKALDPRIRVLWRITAGLTSLAITVGGVVASVLNGVTVAWAIAGGVFILGAGITTADLRFARWRYEIREHDVFLASGVLFHQMAAVPFDRIQYVETHQGPLDRRLGLMRLEVRTAGGNETIPGLSVPEAQSLRDRLAEVAGALGV